MSSSTLRRIAILTGGGDAPGMNAAVRAVSRLALGRNWEVYGIRHGFYGLMKLAKTPIIDLKNCPHVLPMKWDTTSWAIRDGGSCLGTIRCPELKGNDNLASQIAKKLCVLKIDGLVVIGGNGSLQGAHAIHAASMEEGKVNDCKLGVVVIPASIDNDIPLTEMSIGVDTALNVIVECADKLVDTIAAVNRVVVMEVMGRDCGYLAVRGALATGAEAVFSPEHRITNDELNHLLDRLREEYRIARRHALVVVGEGAAKGMSPTEYIRNYIEVGKVGDRIRDDDSPPWDVRATILGHLQRGGPTSAFDRILATRMGSAAVNILAKDTSKMPEMVTLKDGKIDSVSTKDVIERIHDGETSASVADLQEMVELTKVVSLIPEREPAKVAEGTIAVLTAGADAPGMNMALRAVSRSTRNKCRMKTIGFENGFHGLISNNYRELTWETISENPTEATELPVDLHRRAGSILGCLRREDQFTSEECECIRSTLQEHKIRGLVVIGGLNSCLRTLELSDFLGEDYKLPIVVIPASIDHGLPGTHATLGYDSALNVIVSSSDHIIDTGQATDRVSIVETMGGEMGALALAGALASGTELALIPETCRDEKDVHNALDNLSKRMASYEPPRKFATILIKSGLYDGYDVSKIQGYASRAFDTEVRVTELGYTQRGGSTSYYDRMLGTQMGASAVDLIYDCIETNSNDAKLLQLLGGKLTSNDLKDAIRGWGKDSRQELAKELWSYEELKELFDNLVTRP